MTEQTEEARVITDRLDADGNVTKATTKGYSIGAAALAAFLLLRAFLDVADEYSQQVSSAASNRLGHPGSLCGSTYGRHSDLHLQRMGQCRPSVVRRRTSSVEVRRQFAEMPGIMQNTQRPDYNRCVSIVTRAALKEMIRPGVLAVSTPIVVGFLFRFVGLAQDDSLLGVKAVAGMLMFSTATGILMALYLNNAGGAFDNCRRSTSETGAYGGKHSPAHQAAVTGDTLGDPLKDTAGPSIHVLIKLLSTVALVTCPLYLKLEVWTQEQVA